MSADPAGFLNSCPSDRPLSLVQALTVGYKRQEDHRLFAAGGAKHLAHVLSGWLAVQICQQGPGVEHDDVTFWSCHAGVLPSASAANASGAIARAC
jgi:hypothetical protein